MKNSDKMTLKEKMKRYGNLFPFYIPAVIFALVFLYFPMFGLIMAFKDNPNLIGSDSAFVAIFEAPFNNFENFKYIFSRGDFINAIRNTLIISGLKIIIIFPIPIILAIILTEVRGKKIVKLVEIAMYLPYFLSWVIIGMVFTSILSKDIGVVNNILDSLGYDRIPFLTSNDTFRGSIVFMSAWKDAGWSTITYIAAIMALDTSQQEAAQIDGATKMQRIRHITLPGITATIAVLFILRIGYIMDAGFEQIYVIYSPLIQETGDILGTYSFRLIRGSLIPQYGYSAAIGLMNSFIALILIVSGNFISKKLFNRGVW